MSVIVVKNTVLECFYPQGDNVDFTNHKTVSGHIFLLYMDMEPFFIVCHIDGCDRTAFSLGMAIHFVTAMIRLFKLSLSFSNSAAEPNYACSYWLSPVNSLS